MNHVIFYFTGTGNSLWVARKLEAQLLLRSSKGESIQVHPLTHLQMDTEGRAHSPNLHKAPGAFPVDASIAVGLVFPVHAWGVPSVILRSLDLLQGAGYYYALAVNAGQVANTLVQLSRVMQKKGMALSAGFSIRMPSNYLPFGGAEPEEDQRTWFQEAEQKIRQVAGVVSSGAVLPVEKGPLWQNLLLSGLNGLFASHSSTLDKRFYVQDSCMSCGVCERVCPVGNIRLENGHPVWLHHCEQCYACIQWCPEEAIQYGKGTIGKKRYHNPEISLEDMERQSVSR